MGLLSSLLGAVSGNNSMKVSEQLLFDKVIGFKSIVPGCGASTLLQNVAIALSDTTKFNICVLDTNFMYPIQYPLLSTVELKKGEPDILDFAGDLSKITRSTSYPNIYVAQIEHKTVIDMLSGKDSETNITKLIANLKTYFDIILIDLSYELTNTSIYSAIKCNKIIQVADTSFKCLYNIQKAMNTMVTLGVPLAKCNGVVINKELPNVQLGIQDTLEEAGLKVIDRIPLSMDVAISCAAGRKIYGAMSRDGGVTAFNSAIQSVLDYILEKTPLNSNYVDVAKELAKMDAAQQEEKEKSKAEEDLFMEEVTYVDEEEEFLEDELVEEVEELVDEVGEQND